MTASEPFDIHYAFRSSGRLLTITLLSEALPVMSFVGTSISLPAYTFSFSYERTPLEIGGCSGVTVMSTNDETFTTGLHYEHRNASCAFTGSVESLYSATSSLWTKDGLFIVGTDELYDGDLDANLVVHDGDSVAGLPITHLAEDMYRGNYLGMSSKAFYATLTTGSRVKAHARSLFEAIVDKTETVCDGTNYSIDINQLFFDAYDGAGLTAGRMTFHLGQEYFYGEPWANDRYAYRRGHVCQKVYHADGFRAQVIGYSLDLAEGAWVALHDGSSIGAPVLRNFTGPIYANEVELNTYIQPSADVFTLNFYASESVTSSGIGFLFVVRVLRHLACPASGYDVPYSVASICPGITKHYGETPYETTDTYINQTCVYNLIDEPGYGGMIIDFYATTGVTLDFYIDGVWYGNQNNGSYMDQEDGTLRGLILLPAQIVKMVYNAGPYAGNFAACFDHIPVTPPPVCSGTEEWFPTDTLLVHGREIGYGYAPGLNCRWILRTPPGYRWRVSLGSGTVLWSGHDYFSVMQGGRLLYNGTGRAYLDTYLWGGDITLQFTSGMGAPALSKEGANRYMLICADGTNPFESGFLILDGYSGSPTLGDVWRRMMNFPIASGICLPFVRSLPVTIAERYAPCRMILGEHELYINTPSDRNMSFPNLENNLSVLQIYTNGSAPTTLSFPILQWGKLEFGDLVQINDSYDLLDIFLPVWEMSCDLHIEMDCIRSFSAPRFQRLLGYFYVHDMPNFESLYVPLFYGYVQEWQLDSLPVLSNVTIRADAQFGGSSLFLLNLPKLPAETITSILSKYVSLISTLSIVNMLAAEVNVSNIALEDSSIYLANNNFLRTFTTTARHIQCTLMEGNYLLKTINFPNFGVGDFRLTYSAVETLTLPCLSQGNVELTNNVKMTTLNLPAFVQATTYFKLTGSQLTTLSLPKMAFIYELTLANNKKLARLDMCPPATVQNLNAGSLPAMSCTDFTLFEETVVAGYDNQKPFLRPPNCDGATQGTFGCVFDQTLTLANTTNCTGNSLSCIQELIDRSIGGQNNLVYLSPGTYTECPTDGLNFRGKAVTLYGASASTTIVDCQGVGRALAFTRGEGPDTLVEALTFRNGHADVGGLVLIDGASPTIVNCVFDQGLATSQGGIVAIINGAAPQLENCIVSHGTALGGGGGGIWIDSSTPYLFNMVFRSNTAATDGGGVLFTGTAVDIAHPLVIHGGVISLNSALRGAGIFAEDTILLEGITCAYNHASQFGGGFAAVPTASLGVWFYITGGNFSFNTAGVYGGGLFSYSGNLDIHGAEIDDNTANTGGGGLGAVCSQDYRILFGIDTPCEVVVQLRGATMSGNRASLTTGSGGAVMLQQMILLTTNVIVSNNMAFTGAGLFLTAASVYANQTTLQANIGTQGGGVYCEPLAGVCDFRHSQFINNIAQGAGSGAYFCTVACASSSNSAIAPTSYVPPNLAANGNTLNDKPATTYGNEAASDPTRLEFLADPELEIVSGRSLVAGSAPLTVRVLDAYGQVVTQLTSGSLLTVSLEVSSRNGSAVDGISVGGAQTVLANNGLAVFDGVSIIAANLSLLDLPYTLRARLTEVSAVAIEFNFTLAACAPGQGRDSLEAAIVCSDCAGGSYSSTDTVYVCTSCAAGSFSTVGSGACTPCAQNTHAPAAGAASCVACPDGYSAGMGAVDCTLAAAALSTGAVAGIIGGVSTGVLVAICVAAFFIYRYVRRRVLLKYYLDNDATIRTGTQETPLQKEVKRIILATSTTRIGGGYYSTVYKAKYENEYIALKVIKAEVATNGTAQQEFRREAVALSRLEGLRHPGIVSLKFFLSYNPMCIGVGFCNGGSLKNALIQGMFRTLPEHVRLCAEAASAFTAIHDSNIVHLDIKTDNILLTADHHIIVADFGIARVLQQPESVQMPNEYTSVQYPSGLFSSTAPAPPINPTALNTMDSNMDSRLLDSDVPPPPPPRGPLQTRDLDSTPPPPPPRPFDSTLATVAPPPPPPRTQRSENAGTALRARTGSNLPAPTRPVSSTGVVVRTSSDNSRANLLQSAPSDSMLGTVVPPPPPSTSSRDNLVPGPPPPAASSALHHYSFNSNGSSINIITTSAAYDTAYTIQYVDPLRVIQDMNDNEPYLFRADMFSFGTLMWAIASGCEPYIGESPTGLLDSIRDNPNRRPPPLANSAPPFLQPLINRCWQSDPWQRPLMREVFLILAKEAAMNYGTPLDKSWIPQ